MQHGTRMECQVQKVRKIAVHHLSEGILFHGYGCCGEKGKGRRRSNLPGMLTGIAGNLPADPRGQRTEMAHD